MKEIEVKKNEGLQGKDVLKNAVAGVSTAPAGSCSCNICNLFKNNMDDAGETRTDNRF